MVELRIIGTKTVRSFPDDQAHRIMSLASSGWEYVDPKYRTEEPELTEVENIQTGHVKALDPEHVARLLAKKNSGYKAVAPKKNKKQSKIDADTE